MSLELFDLTGDMAVVTGAGRGIGEGIAKVLAGAGATVVCAARRADEIERVASELRDAGGKTIAIATDVTIDAEVDALALFYGPNEIDSEERCWPPMRNTGILLHPSRRCGAGPVSPAASWVTGQVIAVDGGL